jgi:uncharacterized protein
MPAAPNRPAHQTALITGASAGLGAEFARQLAAKGVHLVLTARRVDRLEALGQELVDQFGIEVTVLGLDLAQPDAVDDLVAQLEAQDLHIDWLVNNAGYGLTGNFESRSWDEHADFLRVLLEAPLKLTHRLLPAMRKRGFGRVVNVSSLAGLVPSTAGHTLYGAVKSALVRFSQALGQECASAGIHVLALCPGFTLTEFHDVNGTRPKVSKMPKFMWMDAATVVRQGIQSVEAGDLVRTNGLWNAAVHRLTRLLPESWSLKLVAGRAKDFRSQDKLDGKE